MPMDRPGNRGGMANVSVRKGKTAKQVRRARKAIDASKKKSSTVNALTKSGNAERIGGSAKTKAYATADKIGKPKATTPKSVTGPRTKIGAKSFTTRMDKPTSAAKARKAKPRRGY